MDSILRVYILFSSLRLQQYRLISYMSGDGQRYDGKELVPERKWEGVLEMSSGSGYVFSPLLALAFFFSLFFFSIYTG